MTKEHGGLMTTGDGLNLVITLVAALGSGLMAGLFFVFRRSDEGLGSPPRCCRHHRDAIDQRCDPQSLVLVGLLRHRRRQRFPGGRLTAALAAAGAAYLLAGGVLYLVGTLLVTMVCNVPRNNALAAVVPGDAASASLWTAYLSRWTAWEPRSHSSIPGRGSSVHLGAVFRQSSSRLKNVGERELAGGSLCWAKRLACDLLLQVRMRPTPICHVEGGLASGARTSSASSMT
jgi:hypothetical protein